MHYFIKQKQSKSYYDHKAQLHSDPDAAVLQMDFAENFSTFCQDEVQSAHCHNQVTVFTAAFWYQDSCSSAVFFQMI